MKIILLAVGDYKNSSMKELCTHYILRLKKYNPFDIEILSIKNKGRINKTSDIKKSDSDSILTRISPSDYVIILDEKGEQLKSISFSEKLNKWLYRSNKRIVFVLGGSHGFSDQLYARSDYKLSLSTLTFSHQLARIIFLEQLYRAFTILNNEPYHHA